MSTVNVFEVKHADLNQLFIYDLLSTTNLTGSTENLKMEPVMESVPSFVTTFFSNRSDHYQDTRVEGRNDQSIQTLFDKKHNDPRQQEKLSKGRFT